MKAIGFANKFFTLWDVESENVYTTVNNQPRLSGINTRYTYFQNLSTDLNKAKKRFTELTGLEAPDPDTDLKGKTISFTKEKSFDIYEDYEFDKGKYVGKSIKDCTDIPYLYWAYNNILTNVKKEFAKPILLSNNYYISLYDKSSIVTSDDHENELEQKSRDKIRNKEIRNIQKSGSGNIVVNFTRNLDADGMSYDYHTTLYFPKYKIMSYNGYDYGLPTIKDKAKRIKNKEVVLQVKVIKDPLRENDLALEVINIKTINGKHCLN